MENSISLDSISVVLAAMPFLQYLLDLMLKSSVIIGVSYLIASLFSRHISNTGSHLLWLNCMLSVALLPIGMAVFAAFPSSIMDSGPIAVITVTAGLAELTQAGWQNRQLLMGIAYSAVAVLLLLRILVSALALRRIDSQASDCTDNAILRQLQGIRESLDISRTVAVKVSDAVASPMSFGLFNPIVILPRAAGEWSESTIEDVLVHELSHIKRLDWVTMLFCHLLCSLFWLNPLIWFANSRVNEAAEQACDAAVLRHGKDGVDYAEDLLRLARAGLSDRRAPLLAQLMFDEGNLTVRIRNILDGKLIGRSSKVFVAGLSLSALLLVSACSGISLFGASSQDRELQPTNTAIPQYPTRAAQRGITGWVLASFAVTEEGLVDASSIEVIDAEPAAVFDRTSISAASKFEFEPRIRNGQPVRVEGVQYVFRYELEDGGNDAGDVRSPPQANSNPD